MRKSLRLLGLLLCTAMLAGALAACGGGDATTAPQGTQATDGTKGSESATTQATEATTQPQGGDELSGELSMFIHMNDFPEIAQEWADGFMALHSGVTIDLQMMTGATLNENLITRVATNDLPDVFSGNMSEFFTDIADKGMLADVSDTRAWDDMLDNLKPLWTSPAGKAFGVGFGVASTMIYYNKDMFEEAGISEVPGDWEEFLAACELLKTAGYMPLVWMGGDTNILGHGPLVWGLGNDVVRNLSGNFNADILTKPSDFANWDKIYERIVTLEQKGYFPDDYAALTQQNGPQIFTEGGGAMIMHGSWSGSMFFESGINVGVMPAPWNEPGTQLVGVLGTEAGVVVGSSDHEELSKALYDYMLMDSFTTFQHKRQGVPPFKTDQGFILDERMAAYINEMSSLDLTIGIAGHILPAPIVAEAMKLCQDVLLGTSPSDVPGILQEIHEEYLSSKE